MAAVEPANGPKTRRMHQGAGRQIWDVGHAVPRRYDGRVKLTIAGLVLIAFGTVVLWFGGIPYKTNETLVDIGPLKATTTRERTLDIPLPVGAGCIGAGALLLILGGLGKKK